MILGVIKLMIVTVLATAFFQYVIGLLIDGIANPDH